MDESAGVFVVCLSWADLMINRGLDSTTLCLWTHCWNTNCSSDLLLSESVVTKLCFCACIQPKTTSLPICCSVTGLFWLTRPTGVDANNNYNRTACHNFCQGWILPSDLSSLLSQEQSLSVIMRYCEWWLFCFYAAIFEEFFPPTERTSSWGRTKQCVHLTCSSQSMLIYAA